MTFTNGLQTRGVGEVGQCASSGDVLSSRFVNGDEIFAVKVAEMAISGPLLAARAPDIMQSMLHFLGSFCASSHALQDLLKDFPSFSSVAPSYSPRFLPSLENKSNKKSSMFKADVDVFDLLCAPVRAMSEPLVIGSDEGRNVSSKITPFAPRKPPEKSPGAHQMVHKNVCLIKADVDVMGKPCAPTGGGTCVPIVEYDCGQDVSSSIPSITPRLSPKNSPGGPYTLVKMMLHFMDMQSLPII